MIIDPTLGAVVLAVSMPGVIVGLLLVYAWFADR